MPLTVISVRATSPRMWLGISQIDQSTTQATIAGVASQHVPAIDIDKVEGPCTTLQDKVNDHTTIEILNHTKPQLPDITKTTKILEVRREK